MNVFRWDRAQRDVIRGGIAWNWRFAGFGAAMGLVAVVMVFAGEVLTGTYLLIGSVPAAVVGLAPQRDARRPVLIVGVLFGVSILLGSILAVWVPLAVVGMFVVGYLAALVAAVSYTHLRAHETVLDIVCRLLLEKKTKAPRPSSYLTQPQRMRYNYQHNSIT